MYFATQPGPSGIRGGLTGFGEGLGHGVKGVGAGAGALAAEFGAAGGDGQHPAHRGNCIHGLIRVHEVERRDGTEPVSVANQAAAFESIPRSSRSPRCSRRSRLSSSRSAVVSPSPRRASSSPAGLTHLRIALAEASNAPANGASGRPVRASSMMRRRYSGAYAGWVRGIGRLLLPFSPTPSTKAGQLHALSHDRAVL